MLECIKHTYTYIYILFKFNLALLWAPYFIVKAIKKIWQKEGMLV
jgi:hypothetical protein